MMEESPRYGSWMCEVMQTHLKGHLIEVGCGVGNYTSHYADLDSVSYVTALDTDTAAIDFARNRIQRSNIEFFVQDAHKLEEHSCDSIVCANVLEHIEYPEHMVEAFYRALRSGGTMAILVPAHPILYSQFDKEIGHFRRYTRPMLFSLLEGAGFTIDRLFSFNMIGALGWYYIYKIVQRKQTSEQGSRTMIRLFDTYVLPIGRLCERIIKPPFGISIVALCQK